MKDFIRNCALLFITAVMGAPLDVNGDEKKERDGAAHYRTVDEIKTMSRCKVTVIQKAPCYVLFKSADGSRLYVGSPGNTPEIDRFLSTLKMHQTYTLPDAFLDHQKKAM
jgi:hypothetical protein